MRKLYKICHILKSILFPNINIHYCTHTQIHNSNDRYVKFTKITTYHLPQHLTLLFNLSVRLQLFISSSLFKIRIRQFYQHTILNNVIVYTKNLISYTIVVIDYQLQSHIHTYYHIMIRLKYQEYTICMYILVLHHTIELIRKKQ